MREEKIQIEFTDRYGGQAPSWLRGCFHCGAMGCYPVKAHEADDAEAGVPKIIAPGLKGQSGLSSDLTIYEASEVYDRIADGKRESDGWYFIPCDECGGSARVSWLRTVARIPRWLWKGLPFIWESRRFGSPLGLWGDMWMAFKCAYLVDLGIWKP